MATNRHATVRVAELQRRLVRVRFALLVECILGLVGLGGLLAVRIHVAARKDLTSVVLLGSSGRVGSLSAAGGPTLAILNGSGDRMLRLQLLDGSWPSLDLGGDTAGRHMLFSLGAEGNPSAMFRAKTMGVVDLGINDAGTARVRIQSVSDGPNAEFASEAAGAHVMVSNAASQDRFAMLSVTHGGPAAIVVFGGESATAASVRPYPGGTEGAEVEVLDGMTCRIRLLDDPGPAIALYQRTGNVAAVLTARMGDRADLWLRR